jgi:hypothetical protein
MFEDCSAGEEAHVRCIFTNLVNDVSEGCTCDGSCEFGCIGDDSRASLHASRVINRWIEHAPTKGLLAVVPSLLRAIAKWEPEKQSVETSLDIIR